MVFNRTAYSKTDTFTNAWIALGGGIMGMLASWYAVILYFIAFEGFSQFRVNYLGYAEVSWSWYVWPIVLFADDLSYYWFHRLGHRIRLFWACHIVHHSSEHFNFTTAFRNGWLAILYKPLFWIWLAALGVHPAMILICLSLNTGYQFFIHASKGGRNHFLSGVFVTPGLHEVHHGKDAECIDKNYAGTFILIDRIFGTYQREFKRGGVKLGVTRPPENNSVSEVMFHEFKHLWRELQESEGFKDKFKVLFYPPGIKQ